LSDADTVTVTAPDTLCPEEGDTIDTVGGVVSGGVPLSGGTFRMKTSCRVSLPTIEPSQLLMKATYVPLGSTLPLGIER